MEDDTLEAKADHAEFQEEKASLGQFFAPQHPLLDEREKQVLSQRFGLTPDGATATLKDIGSELDISKERVRQLQKKGLNKLREVLAAAGDGV